MSPTTEQQNAICIIVYKEKPSSWEIASFKQCLHVLHKHELLLIYPEHMDTSVYDNIAAEFKIYLQYKTFPQKHFYSISSYNSMMLTEDFYATFAQYKYILIYQLDAWVFRDEFQYWCDQNYTYIGAPFFTNRKELLPYAGNGGFSLRHVQSFRELLSGNYKTKSWNYGFLKATIPAKTSFRQFIKHISHFASLLFCKISPRLFCRYMPLQEDVVFSLAFNFYYHANVPTPEKSAYFSFERFPATLFNMTNKTLPFGCHAFEKYDISFWKDKILPLNEK